MKIPKPAFTERYKAHVGAQRQYASSTPQKVLGDVTDLPIVSRTSQASIEEAYLSIRTENRSHSNSLHR